MYKDKNNFNKTKITMFSWFIFFPEKISNNQETQRQSDGLESVNPMLDQP